MSNVSPMDYPAVTPGAVVTEAHVTYCRTNGHAAYRQDGTESGMCARCGQWRCEFAPGDTDASRCTDAASTYVIPLGLSSGDVVRMCTRHAEDVAAMTDEIETRPMRPDTDASTRAVIDTRHADTAYARQVADEATSGLAAEHEAMHPSNRPVPAPATPYRPRYRTERAGTIAGAQVRYGEGWERIEAGTEAAAQQASADFAASHDAYMREAYREPWDVQPRECPATGDPLTGVYGRTYAEGGYLLMQAAGDLFGPATGSTPILLFAITNDRGESLLHSPMGGARMTHLDTYDTWHAGLSALRWHLDHAPRGQRDYLD